MTLRTNLLVASIVPLILILLVMSYVRFTLTEQYYVAYEVDCDPFQSSCFVGCEDDDDCLDPFFYFIVQKRAATLHAQCGSTIMDCDAARTCEPSENGCSIQYCDLEDETSSCDSISDASNMP